MRGTPGRLVWQRRKKSDVAFNIAQFETVELTSAEASSSSESGDDTRLWKLPYLNAATGKLLVPHHTRPRLVGDGVVVL